MIVTEMKAKRTGATALNRDGKDEITSQAADERINCIATMAYYKAEARGFIPGKEVEDWLTAEAEFEGNERCN